MISNKEKLYDYLKAGQFLDALSHIDKLKPVINNFFDRVLVMDKEERIKINRLALLQDLSEILKSVADLSKFY